LPIGLPDSNLLDPLEVEEDVAPLQESSCEGYSKELEEEEDNVGYYSDESLWPLELMQSTQYFQKPWWKRGTKWKRHRRWEREQASLDWCGDNVGEGEVRVNHSNDEWI